MTKSLHKKALLLWLSGSLLIAPVLVLPFGEKKKNEEGKEKYHPKAAELVIQGAIYDLKREYAKALNSFNEALIYEPNSASICNAIAKDYVMLGKVETARQMLERGIAIDSTYIENYQLLAAIYHRKGQMDLAKKAYLKILALDSSNADARLNLAALYASQDETDKAAMHYEKLIDWGLASREIHFELGNLYFQEKKYDDALRVFRNYVRDNAEDEQGYLAVGAVLLAQDTTAGIAWLKKTYDENRDFKQVLDELTTVLVAAKEWPQAIALYKNEVAEDSTEVFNHLRLGEIYLSKGDTSAAVGVLQNLAEAHPDDWRPFYTLGQITFSDREFEVSRDYYERILALDVELPPHVKAEAWWRLGIIHQQLGDLEAAEEAYRKAQNLQPNHPFTNFQLGQLLFQNKKSEEAVPFLVKAIESDPENAAFIGTLAAVYDELNEHEKSEEYYDRALRIEPDNPTILNNYSYSLSEQEKELEKALEMINKALESDPDNGAFLDTLGWIHYKLGNYEKALEFIQKSIGVRENSAEVLEHLGDVYDKLGQNDRAMEYWQKAFELEPDRESVASKLNDN